MATSATTEATPKAIVTPRSRVPDTRDTMGLAVAIRRTKRPIAAIIERKAIQRAVTSLGDAAVSEVDGIANCGAGPAFGPTANVNAPRTGCPSTEITRQKTRYQPSGTRFSGVTNVCGAPGAEAGAPLVTCCPKASVTETIAKRGSIGSL